MATAVRRKADDGRNRYGTAAYHLNYDGSAARVLEREEGLQPRPQVRPRERVVARPKVQVRAAGSVSIFAVVGFLAVGVFAVLLLLSYVRLATISDQVVVLNGQMEQLKSQEISLRAQYELAYDLTSIEETVTANGSMLKPQSGQVIYLDLSEPDSVMLFQSESEAAAGVAGVLEGAKEIVGNMVEYFK